MTGKRGPKPKGKGKRKCKWEGPRLILSLLRTDHGKRWGGWGGEAGSNNRCGPQCTLPIVFPSSPKAELEIWEDDPSLVSTCVHLSKHSTTGCEVWPNTPQQSGAPATRQASHSSPQIQCSLGLKVTPDLLCPRQQHSPTPPPRAPPRENSHKALMGSGGWRQSVLFPHWPETSQANTET